MSDIEREAFEQRNHVPEDAVWNERKQGYYWSNYPNVNHPFNNDWMIWEEAIEWQAARPAPASGEVDPDIQLIQERDYWEEKATELAEDLGKFLGIEMGEHSSDNCPVQNAIDALFNTHPPAKVPEESWKPSELDYDHSIHTNPDAKAWADFFMATFPNCGADPETIHGWFANAMMAVYDHIQNAAPTPAAAAGAESHEWDAAGERCLKCGDKDWFAGSTCEGKSTPPQEQ